MNAAPHWYRRLFWLKWSILSPNGEQLCDTIAQVEVEAGTSWRTKSDLDASK